MIRSIIASRHTGFAVLLLMAGVSGHDRIYILASILDLPRCNPKLVSAFDLSNVGPIGRQLERLDN